MSNKGRNRDWEIAPPPRSFEKHFKNRPDHTEYIPEFQIDVTENPYFHPTPNKIAKLQPTDYGKNIYRWRKKDLRIVYKPVKKESTIYPLDAGSASSIGYKKGK